MAKKKFADKTAIQQLVSNIKNLFANKKDTEAALAEINSTLVAKQSRILTWGDLLEDPEVVNVAEEGA